MNYDPLVKAIVHAANAVRYIAFAFMLYELARWS